MSASEQVLLTELRRWWGQINVERFEGRLKPPLLELSRRTSDLGRWTSGTRTLSMSWHLLVDRPWGEVVSVLEHEMAHQYVDEVLGIADESAHGPTFRRVCEERGIDSRAAGTPHDTGEPEPGVVRRIRKLLALADSPVEAESKAAMRAAYQLMLRHNVSLAQARAPSRYIVRQLGDVRARHPKHHHLLAGLLGAHFFVDVTLVPGFSVADGRPGRAVEIAGTPENVETATWVWEYVGQTAERLWRAHRQAARVRGDADRRRFLEGVMLGFRDKLQGEMRRSAQEEGLVWVGDPALDDFVGHRHPHRRKGRRLVMQSSESLAAGRQAGKELVLRRPIKERARGTAGLLPGPKRRG